MEFLFEYLGFLAKAATVVIAALIIISSVAAMGAHRVMRSSSRGHIEVVALNEHLQDMRRAIEEAALPSAVVKKRRKSDAKTRKQHRKAHLKELKAKHRGLKAELRRAKRAEKKLARVEKNIEKDIEKARKIAPPQAAAGPQAAEGPQAVEEPQAAEGPQDRPQEGSPVEPPEDPAGESNAAPQEAESSAKATPASATEPSEHQAVVAVADTMSDEPETHTPVASEAAPESAGDRRVFVLSFNGDMEASAVESLRREITAVLGVAGDSDEVVVRVESAGGMVHGYGLAASQLARIRRQGVRLTVAVDKVAASGGYLMAAVADRILAAPFAVLGSIGVVAQIPNVHRLLKKHDVDVEVLTAGRFKRTLDVLGENTEVGREKFREELEDVHALFQEYVGNWRPALDLDTVSTGEAWYGQRALDRALVDELVTSDEYLARACNDADVYEVAWVVPKRPIDKLLSQAAAAAGKAAGKAFDALLDRTTTGGIR